MKQTNSTIHFIGDSVKAWDKTTNIDSKDIYLWREYINNQSSDIPGEHVHDIPRFRELFKNYAWRWLTQNKAWEDFLMMWKNYSSEIKWEIRELKKLSAPNLEILDMSQELFRVLYDPYLIDKFEVSWTNDGTNFQSSQTEWASENTLASAQGAVSWEISALLNACWKSISSKDVHKWVGVPERRKKWGPSRIRNSTTHTTYFDLKNIIKAQLKTVFLNSQPSKKSNIFFDYSRETLVALIQFPYFSPLRTLSSSLSQDIQLSVKCILGPNSRDRILTYLECIENKITFEESIREKFSTIIPCKLKLWVVLIERRELLIGRNTDDQRHVDFTIEMLDQGESK